MPTKPTLTVPDFAVGNYPAGGDNWSGLARRDATNLASWAASGYTPETPILNENLNEYLARIADWSQWVEAGSLLADEDAHIVESDDDGEVNIARLVLSGHGTAGPTLLIGASGSGASIDVTGPGGALFGMTIGNGGTAAALRATQTGTGPALEGQGAGTNNDGVKGTPAGTGRGVYGVSANSAASFGVYGETVHNDGIGVRGKLPATAGANSAAVQGVGENLGSGVLASTVAGANGYALFVFPDATAPLRAGIHIAGQDADPITTQAGDLYYHSGEGQLKLRRTGQVEGIWTTGDGFVHGGEYGQSAALSASATLTAKATAQISPPKIGDVVVEVGFLGGGNNACDGIKYDIYDAMAAAVIAGPFEIEIKVGDGTDQPDHHSVATRINYTLPSAAGGRNIQLRMAVVSTGTFIFEQGYCEVRGLYD